MISLRERLSSAGMQPPYSLLNDLVHNPEVMPSNSLRELLDFNGAGMDQTLRSLGWSDADIRELHNMPPRLTCRHLNYLFWHKGQTHCHSDYCDGDMSADDVEQRYKNKGYTFVCLTDHDHITSDPNVPNILHITSAESGYACRHHMCVLGIDGPQAREAIEMFSGTDTCPCNHSQIRIDVFGGTLQGITVLAHPTSSHYQHPKHWTCGHGWGYQDDLRNNTRYTGLEFFCGGLWSDEWWDLIVANYYSSCWGFAADDFEKVKRDDQMVFREDDPNKRNRSFNRGWIVVNSTKSSDKFIDEREDELRTDILQNIREGNFVSVARSPDMKEGEVPPGDGISSTGPRFRIGVLGDLIVVQTDQESTVRFMGVLLQPAPEAFFSRPDDPEKTTRAVYRLQGDECFVRVVVERNELDGEIYRSYSQPLGVI